MESMDDYKEELEASFRRIREGDILTGTVIDVNEEGVTLDLKYYAPGFISAEEMSSDPDFSLAEAVHVGDTIEATVIRVDDGAGNILLSRREANEEQAWEKLKEMMEEGTTVTVRIKESVKAGVVAYLEGIRAFIPASQITSAMWRIRRAGLEKRFRSGSLRWMRSVKNSCFPERRSHSRQRRRSVITRSL